jgi:hypothetical protein
MLVAITVPETLVASLDALTAGEAMEPLEGDYRGHRATSGGQAEGLGERGGIEPDGAQP